MAEPNQIVFTYTEVVEALLKKEGIHEGIWGLYVEFGIQAANVGLSLQEAKPAAIIPVMKIGLQKFEEEGSLSVDAGRVNPKSGPGRKTTRPT
jgi:hypothetical protein